MNEPLDAYTDGFQLSTGPYGGILTFVLSPAMPTAPGVPAVAAPIATMRMSIEHLKVLAFILHRQAIQHEREIGAIVPVPQQALNPLGVGPEDWEHFWRHPEGN